LKIKLLIIGGSGLVGSTIIQYSEQNYDLHATFNKNKIEDIKTTKIDLLEDRKKILDLISTLKPNVVIHTAAHPSVDLCENNPKQADILHVDVTKDISEACSTVKSKLIYFSTDAVFEGKINKKYTEDDQPKPINHYGETKLEAEKIILNASSKNVILRTAVIYGWHKKSRFTNWILNSLVENKTVDPFIDQYNTPTFVDDLAKSVLRIIEMNISGLFHASGKSCINRYEFALTLAKVFRYNQSLIKPVTSKEKKQDAPRPVSTCLDSSKLENQIKFQFCDILTGINQLHQSHKNGIPQS